MAAGHDRPSALAFSSKYCRERFVYPSPKKAPGAFLSALLDRLKGGGYVCVLPMGDETMGIAARHQAVIKRFARLLIPPASAVETALDKGKTVLFAAARGFPCPRRR